MFYFSFYTEHRESVENMIEYQEQEEVYQEGEESCRGLEMLFGESASLLEHK